MDGHIVPAGPAPPGVSSNFIDPVNMAPNLVACNVALLVVSVLIVAARIVSRTVLTDWRLGWDDWTMVLALIGTAIFASFVIITTHFGLGKHIWDVPLSTYTPQYLWWIMATFAACPASYYFVKISILLFYLRVFQLQAKLRYIIYFLFAYCTIYYWVAFFSIIGLCNVKNRSWDITLQENCFADARLTLTIGGLDLVADVLILAFPVPMVLKLRITWAQRIYLLFVFLAGILASAACAMRVALAAQSRGTTDATMAQYHVVTLFCIEHYLALIAACMPTLGPLFRWLRPSYWKHVQIGHKTRGDNPYDDVEGFHCVWPRPTKTSPDDSLLHGSIGVASSADKNLNFTYCMQDVSRQQTPQSVEAGWVKSDAYGVRKNSLRNEMELPQAASK
ncbi:hypothetical protein MMC28_005221 [Mycoblastus sanguinarius]|nr:hypothetical protein [Mycoblastus sanguinarius]